VSYIYEPIKVVLLTKPAFNPKIPPGWAFLKTLFFCNPLTDAT